MPHQSRSAGAERCFNFTEAAVERVLRAAAMAAHEDGQRGDQRQLWRDEAGNGLYLRVSPRGGTYYRIHKARGKKIKVRIGDATTMKVSKAREIALKLAGGNRDAAPPPIRVRTDGPSVAKAWAAYLADSRSGRFRMARKPPQESTLKSYEELYRPHIQQRFGHKSLHYLARHVREIHEHMADRPAAANRLLTAIKNLYVHAAKNGYWSGPNPTIDPTRGKSFLKYPRKSRRRYMNTSEMARVFAAVSRECDPWPDFFPLLLLTGVRKGTLRHARWEEFDLDAPQPLWQIPHTKNGEGLLLPLVETAVEILRARLARCSVKVKGGRKPTSEWVFPRKGNPMIPIRDTREAWERIVEAAGVQGIRMHDVRRTHGTVATIGGASIQEVGRSLGHKTIQATQVYALADVSSAKRAAAIVESSFIAAKAAIPPEPPTVRKKSQSPK